MCEAYFSAFQAGDPTAISLLMDFFGGPGTFASWPTKVRAYAVQTTPVNILDWATANHLPLAPTTLSTIKIPTSVVVGGASPQAIQRSNALLAECIDGATFATVKDAAHFLIATHADQVAALIAEHVQGAGDFQQQST
jgi:pimeloyl-ACP methyl ester carboxylesterase